MSNRYPISNEEHAAYEERYGADVTWRRSFKRTTLDERLNDEINRRNQVAALEAKKVEKTRLEGVWGRALTVEANARRAVDCATPDGLRGAMQELMEAEAAVTEAVRQLAPFRE